MDDDTVDEQLAEEQLCTIPDNIALEMEVGDTTVVTSAAPPEHDEAPWPDRYLTRGAVYFASGSTRVA